MTKDPTYRFFIMIGIGFVLGTIVYQLFKLFFYVLMGN